MTQGRPIGESGRGVSAPTTWVVEPMSTNDSAAQERADTADEQITTAIDNLAAIREGEDPR